MNELRRLLILFHNSLLKFFPLLLGKSDSRLSVRVVQCKVVHNYWNRECNSQHSAQHTQRPYQVPSLCPGNLVPIPHRRHGYQRPPKPHRYVWEGGVLCVEDETSEDEDSGEEEDDQKQQLLGAHFDGVDEDLEGGVVLHQLEDPQDPNNSQSYHRLKDLAGGVVGVDGFNDDGNEVRQQTQDVDDVHECADEHELLGCEVEAHHVLHGEERRTQVVEVAHHVVGVAHVVGNVLVDSSVPKTERITELGYSNC